MHAFCLDPSAISVAYHSVAKMYGLAVVVIILYLCITVACHNFTVLQHTNAYDCNKSHCTSISTTLVHRPVKPGNEVAI